MKIVIIEDEILAANRLKKIISEIDPSAEILETIESVNEAINWFKNNDEPDLIFSDIQLSDGLSFEIYKVIPLNCPIIFTTAYEEYAIRAFKLNSLDYLLKPIETDELRASIEKFKKRDAKTDNIPDDIEDLLKDLNIPKAEYKSRFLVKFGEIYKTAIDEKESSDKLLLNILPSEIAEELKRDGSAKTKKYDLVTVLFTDFKGFTLVSEKLSPEQLVKEIDYCYKEFDNITGKYGIEKIKTIGDSYMCAGGLPIANTHNPIDVVNAGLDILSFIETYKKEKQQKGEVFFEIRIGIHTGPVVAGIVGIKKFAYDIWGDTVNIASRMESSGEAGKVNISGATYELIKEHFDCTYRGKFEAKYKGMVDMYFVEGRKKA